MENADKLASKGNLKDARNLLDKTSNDIINSKTGKTTFATSLVNDMNRCKNNLKDQNQYLKQGTKMLRMNVQSHQQQRSVQSNNWGAQMQYANCSKAYYKSSFNKKH